MAFHIKINTERLRGGEEVSDVHLFDDTRSDIGICFHAESPSHAETLKYLLELAIIDNTIDKIAKDPRFYWESENT